MKTKTKSRKEPKETKISFTKVQEQAYTKLDVTCSAHGKKMEQVGSSEKGLTHYYCQEGCKAEIGIGRVKKVIQEDGYGFIYTGEDDVFFHFSNLSEEAKPVERGDLVKFRIGYNPVSSKLQAVRIKSLEGMRR